MTLDKFLQAFNKIPDSQFKKEKRVTCWNNISPIRYIGGKSFLVSWIKQFIPYHDNYIEVFGGGASLLFSKNESICEVYNDLDDNLVNFFQQLRDNPRELFRALYFRPYSRSEFLELRKKFLEKKCLDNLERAVVYFYLNRVSFGGNMKSLSFGYCVYSIRKGSIVSKSYIKELESLFFYWNRIKKVIIEKLDFRDLIRKYDRPQSLFYLDPPYFNIDYYKFNFSEADHKDLAEILKEIEGKFILSYNYDERLETLYPREEFVWENKVFSNKFLERETKIVDKRQELLIMNFNIKNEKKFMDKRQKTLGKFLQ